MRLLRFVVTALFVLVCAVAVFFNLKTKPDTAKPTIVCSVDEIHAKCNVNEAKLLKYVTAQDEKDGDLTDKIFVENITSFISEGVSIVNFCVEDSDGNLAKKSVRLVYTDYKKPNLVLKDDLVFAEDAVANLSDAAKVTDKFDGDITGRLYTIFENGKDSSSQQVLFKVTNSKGYTYEWRFDVARLPADEIGAAYKIKLSKNLLNLPLKAKKPNFESFVKDVLYNGKSFEDGTVVVDDSEFSTKKKGTFSIWFRLYTESEESRTLLATERLIVVCGGNK